METSETKTGAGEWRVICEDGKTHEVAVTHCDQGTPWRADFPPVGGSAVGRTPRGAVMVIVRLAQWKVAEILAPGQKTRAEVERELAAIRTEVDALKAAQASARREGAEAMREACATVATEHAAAARARRSAFCEDDRGYDSADAALDAAEEIAAAIRAIPLPEARPPATVPCGMCDGRGKVLLGREVEDGCDECDASGRVDAVAEVARLRERVKHYQMQATHHAIVDMDAREAAKREAVALRVRREGRPASVHALVDPGSRTQGAMHTVTLARRAGLVAHVERWDPATWPRPAANPR